LSHQLFLKGREGNNPTRKRSIILAKYLKSEKVSKEKTKVKEEEFYEPFAIIS